MRKVLQEEQRTKHQLKSLSVTFKVLGEEKFS